MIKNFGRRRLSTLITLAGIALVIFVFTAVLMMANGVKKTLVATGSPDNVVITRKGSNGEISSIILGETQNVVQHLPYIAKTPDGAPAISYQPVVVINLTTPDGAMSNVTVRGVSQQTLYIHPNVKIIEGRMFNPALREVIVGESVAKEIPGCTNGRLDQIGRRLLESRRGFLKRRKRVRFGNLVRLPADPGRISQRKQRLIHHAKLDNPSDYRQIQTGIPRRQTSSRIRAQTRAAIFRGAIGNALHLYKSGRNFRNDNIQRRCCNRRHDNDVRRSSQPDKRNRNFAGTRIQQEKRTDCFPLRSNPDISFTGGLLGIVLASLLQFVLGIHNELYFLFGVDLQLCPFTCSSLASLDICGVHGNLRRISSLLRRAARLNIVSALRGE